MDIRTDIRTDITTAIITLIEQGQPRGEGCLWDAAGRFGMPINFRTKREYSGVNVLLRRRASTPLEMLRAGLWRLTHERPNMRCA